MAVRDLLSSTGMSSIILVQGEDILVGTPLITSAVDLSASGTIALMITTAVQDVVPVTMTFINQYSETTVDGDFYDEVADQNLGNTVTDLDGNILANNQVIITDDEPFYKHLIIVNNPANSSLSITEAPDKLMTRYYRLKVEATGTGMFSQQVIAMQRPLRFVGS